MLRVVVLGGWAAPFRPPKGRIEHLTRTVLLGRECSIYGATAKLAGWQMRKTRRAVGRWTDPTDVLLIVGKSLGGWKALTGLVNRVELRFSAVGLVLVDPCHPKLWNWWPDRSGDTLPLHSGRVDYCVNLLSSPGSRPRGAQVQGVQARVVPNSDHYDIVRHVMVREEVAKMVKRLTI